MDGVHDMGGMAGFGPVDPAAVGPTDEPWELRAQVVAMLGGDGMRPAIEAIPPAQYLAAGYYERWLLANERRSVDSGRVDVADLERWRAVFDGDPDLTPPHIESGRDPDHLVAALIKTPLLRPVETPEHAVGDRVRVRRMRPEAHHRCPRYVRGVVGVVDNVPGAQPTPQPRSGVDEGPPVAVYTVRFDSTDLWGDHHLEGDPPFDVYVDLWEHYLEPAT